MPIKWFRSDFLSSKIKNKFFRSTPGLCYHNVLHEKTIDPNLHGVHLEHFERQIDTLIKWGVAFLPAEEYLEEKSKGTSANITSVTFDDGYRDVMENASPILSSRNIPHTIFLNTRILEKRIFWRDKVRIVLANNWVNEFRISVKGTDLQEKIDWERFYRSTKGNHINSMEVESALDDFLSDKDMPLVDDGDLYITQEDLKNLTGNLASIGNHTHDHYRLSTLSRDEQYDQISSCQSIINDLDCQTCNVFAIPFGENSSFNQDTIDILSDLGFHGFFMTNSHHFGRRNPQMEVDPRGLCFANRILPKNQVILA